MGQFGRQRLMRMPMARVRSGGMTKRSPKPTDLNRLAASIVEQATTGSDASPESPQARAGRRGGQRGGRARAERLSPEERSQIARKAAQARWARRA